MIPEYLGLPFKEDEPGVHGGEYSVRPGRQESMVFLRKLFTHQQEGGMVYPSLISPPDGPMRKLLKSCECGPKQELKIHCLSLSLSAE
jgi:hypothetical protein